MFYDQLVKLCKERNVRITPLVRSLGLGEGGIKRWRDGSSPTGETLLKFADYFGVSTDYLLTGKELQRQKVLPDKELSIEELIKMVGITSDEHVKSLKSIIDLMKQSEHNAAIADEFMQTRS